MDSEDGIWLTFRIDSSFVMTVKNTVFRAIKCFHVFLRLLYFFLQFIFGCLFWGLSIEFHSVFVQVSIVVSLKEFTVTFEFLAATGRVFSLWVLTLVLLVAWSHRNFCALAMISLVTTETSVLVMSASGVRACSGFCIALAISINSTSAPRTPTASRITALSTNRSGLRCSSSVLVILIVW